MNEMPVHSSDPGSPEPGGFSLRPGTLIAERYRMVRFLGRGGFGVVWLAMDEQLRMEVALKLLSDLVMDSPEAVEDLKLETKNSLRLTHPSIVRIYGFFQSPETSGISMEFVDGGTLSALKAQREARCFEAADLTHWVHDLCMALDYAHQKVRIVHRDLKPGNLMVDKTGELKVADFGIARTISDTYSRLTNLSRTSGTLAYMSPQQLMGHPAKVTDDIYSLGATLYDLLTGRPPFYTGDVPHQIRTSAVPSMAERRRDLQTGRDEIPPQWEAAVAACLAKEPGDRPQGAGQIAEMLGLRAASSWHVHVHEPEAQSGEISARTVVQEAFSDHTERQGSLTGGTEMQTPPSGRAVVPAPEGDRTVVQPQGASDTSAHPAADPSRRSAVHLSPDEPRSPRRAMPRWAIPAAAGVVAAVVGGWFFFGRGPAEVPPSTRETAASRATATGVVAAEEEASPEASAARSNTSATDQAASLRAAAGPGSSADEPGPPRSQDSPPRPSGDNPEAQTVERSRESDGASAPSSRSGADQSAAARTASAAPPASARAAESPATRRQASDQAATSAASAGTEGAAGPAEPAGSPPDPRAKTPGTPPPPASAAAPSTQAPATEPSPSAAESTPAPEESIRRLLAQYERALENLDAAFYVRLRPDLSADDRSRVESSFADLKAQTVELDEPSIEVRGSTATARFRERRQLQPKAGKEQTIDHRVVMTFTRTAAGAWEIGKLEYK